MATQTLKTNKFLPIGTPVMWSPGFEFAQRNKEPLTWIFGYYQGGNKVSAYSDGSGITTIGTFIVAYQDFDIVNPDKNVKKSIV